MFSSRASSRPRNQTQVSYIGRQILYPLNHPGSPERCIYTYKTFNTHTRHIHTTMLLSVNSSVTFSLQLD